MLFALTLFVSCKKGETAVDEIIPNTLHHVSFNISGFSQKIVNMGVKSSATVKAESAASHVNYIVYCIYNNEGVLLKKVEQNDKAAAGFGAVKEQLPAGSYTLAVAAGTKRFSIAGSDLLKSAFVTSHSESHGDTFVKVLKFDINDKDHQADIEIDRVVAKLELVILDQIPLDVSKITMMSTSASFYHFIKSTSSLTDIITEEVFVTESNKIGEGSTFDSFILPMRATGSLTTDITISCYNAKGDVIVNKVVKNVVFETNKKTILSGKLFEKTSNQQSNFQITIPQTWAGGTTINF